MMERISTVLLIENNPDDARLAQLAFERAQTGHRLVIVQDGTEAMDFLCKKAVAGKKPSPPKLILLDLGMPGVSGLELMERLAQDPDLKQIPVAVLSGSNYSLDVERAYELGAKAYVEKTSDFGTFRAALRKLIEDWVEPPCGRLSDTGLPSE